MASKNILQLSAILSLTFYLGAHDESSNPQQNERAANNTIAYYDATLDKNAVNTLLQNNPYKIETVTEETLAEYYNNSSKDIDETTKTPQGVEVHVRGTQACKAKIILNHDAASERKAAGIIFYCIATFKEPMESSIATITLCTAENATLEKELFVDALQDIKTGVDKMIIYAFPHCNNTSQNELVKQLGFSCISQNVINPKTGKPTNISAWMLLIGQENQDQSTSANENNVQSNVIHATKDTIATDIEQCTTPVILDLYATWCPPCKQLAPILEELAGEYEGKYTFIKYDTAAQCDFMTKICTEYKVRGIPTLFFINNGVIKGIHTGYLSKEALKEKIAQYLS